MHILMTVSSITVMNMRNWMFVLFKAQSGIRSSKMIQVMLMGASQEKKYPLRICGISL
jgi:hypothetical protein